MLCKDATAGMGLSWGGFVGVPIKVRTSGLWTEGVGYRLWPADLYFSFLLPMDIPISRDITCSSYLLNQKGVFDYIVVSESEVSACSLGPKKLTLYIIRN